jgi:hypothetical protein
MLRAALLDLKREQFELAFGTAHSADDQSPQG